MTFNPNAVFISPSSISDFKTCPQTYYYRNVYRNPKTGLKIQIINPKLALGATVHDILAQFLHTQGIEKTKDQLLNILQRYWGQITGEKGGFKTEEEEKQYKERASKMLDIFWGNNHFREVQPVKLPDFPKVYFDDDLILTGKLDWIELETENKYHIIDFKTGENEERSDSMQLPIYAVLASNILKTSEIKASYWYLDRDADLKKFDLPDLKETTEKLKKIGYVIKNSRLTNSFKCSSGYESCWSCKDLLSISNGKGKLVSVDYNRKQEVYIIPPTEDKPILEKPIDDIPF
ncbi:MAG: PD-(D/E)XK nuclease family protein [Candidatus Gottesmanbacteria bacterium]